LLGEEAVRRKWGVTPEQIGEVLSLIGDSVDNIPGVDGLGSKGAANLLSAHGSLDAILENVEIVKNDRMREKLRNAREQIIQNREMVRLDRDLPLPKPLADLALTPRYDELIAEIGCCEFKSLMDEIKAEAAAATQTAPAVTPPSTAAPARQGELF
jgi:DNA polymerase-1